VTKMIILERGKPYPLPINQKEGATAQFLMKSGSVLQISLPDMSAKEDKALRSGMIKAGFLYDSGSILFLFQFYGDQGKPLITLAAPFDARLITAKDRELNNIDNAEQRLAIEIHAVDEKQILRALRVVTMPPAMTLKFFSAVQEQLSVIDNPGVMANWMQRQPHELIEATETWILGK
jgi:hypothetical protein